MYPDVSAWLPFCSLKICLTWTHPVCPILPLGFSASTVFLAHRFPSSIFHISIFSLLFFYTGIERFIFIMQCVVSGYPHFIEIAKLLHYTLSEPPASTPDNGTCRPLRNARLYTASAVVPEHFCRNPFILMESYKASSPIQRQVLSLRVWP